ncbi:MAG: hypothetical protein K2W96_10465 [Gemmataceae bacterium]|nr:hypothetical protein [Gemmataceae bacterium]
MSLGSGWATIAAAWSANPAMWIGLIALAAGSRPVAAAFGALALALPMPFAFQTQGELFKSPAFLAWVGSTVVLLVGSLVGGSKPEDRRRGYDDGGRGPGDGTQDAYAPQRRH